MNKYFVELDGISLISSHLPLGKGDFVSLSDDGEVHHYRVRDKKDRAVNLRLVKTVCNTVDGVKYYLDDLELFFENRLSKNQFIVVNGYLCKVADIEKKTNSLTLEVQDEIVTQVIYGVYESRSEKESHKEREKESCIAEKYFTNWGKAFGYIMTERAKGRKVSF